MNIAIQGDGVAACCCAYILKKAGHRVRFQRVNRARPPVVMLSEAALTLLRDVFEDPELLRDARVIRRRTVAWGADSSPSTLEHAAVVISERLLLERIGNKLELDAQPDCNFDWTIIAAEPLCEWAARHTFGSRTAFAVPVNLAIDSDAESCWIESLEQGWLFLIPDTPTSGWLLSIGSPPESMVSYSRVIGPQIDRITGVARQFLVAPGITVPLVGDEWLLCGAAAVSFDPICGDGTAYAAREAILASAVIQASADGVDPNELLPHYRDRVIGGFARHLSLCHQLYRSGHNGPWWNSQLDSLEQGLRWCKEHLEGQTVKFQLTGFQLTRLETM